MFVTDSTHENHLRSAPIVSLPFNPAPNDGRRRRDKKTQSDENEQRQIDISFTHQGFGFGISIAVVDNAPGQSAINYQQLEKYLTEMEVSVFCPANVTS